MLFRSLSGVYHTASTGETLRGFFVGGWIQTECSEPDLPAE